MFGDIRTIEGNLNRQMNSIFNHVFSTPRDTDRFSLGYEDAWSDDVIKPAHPDDKQYMNGWSLGLEYKGK